MFIFYIQYLVECLVYVTVTVDVGWICESLHWKGRDFKENTVWWYQTFLGILVTFAEL
jgi:hypothetical protein